MPSQTTPSSPATSTSSSAPEITALLERLHALDTELVEHRRHLAYALDDLSATLEQSRQVRQQLLALITQGGAR